MHDELAESLGVGERRSKRSDDVTRNGRRKCVEEEVEIMTAALLLVHP